MQSKKPKCDENIRQKITDYTPLTAIFGKTLIRILRVGLTVVATIESARV
jgi:hypothetical protein